MRALVLSPTPTHPSDYGHRKRVSEIAHQLRASGYQIHFVHYLSDHDWRDGVLASSHAEMRAEWDEYDFIPASIPVHNHPFNGKYHHIDEWWDPAIGVFLKAIRNSWKYDVFVVHYTWLSKALEFAPLGCLRILDTIDRFTGRRELLEKMGIPPEYFYLTGEEEGIAFSRADIVWAIKDEEKSYFEKICAKKIYVVPHRDRRRQLSRTKEVSTSTEAAARLHILFTGARNNINLRNLTRFISALETQLRKTPVSLTFLIAGSICDDLEDLNKPWIKLLGRFQEPQEVYKQADVVVVPMEISTGIKIKVAEALSFGLPVVAHAHAFEGYVSSHEYHDLPTMREVALACITLALHPELLPELAEASTLSQKKAELIFENSIKATLDFRHDVSKSGLIVLPKSALLKKDARMLEFIDSNLNIMKQICRVYTATLGEEVFDRSNMIREYRVDGDDFCEIDDNSSEGIRAFASVSAVRWFCPLCVSESVKEFVMSSNLKILLHPDVLFSIYGDKAIAFCQEILGSKASGLVAGSEIWRYRLLEVSQTRFSFMHVGMLFNPGRTRIGKRWQKEVGTGGIVVLSDNLDLRKSHLLSVIRACFSDLTEIYVKSDERTADEESNPRKFIELDDRGGTYPRRPKFLLNLSGEHLAANSISDVASSLGVPVIHWPEAGTVIDGPHPPSVYGAIMQIYKITRDEVLYRNLNSDDFGAASYYQAILDISLDKGFDIFDL